MLQEHHSLTNPDLPLFSGKISPLEGAECAVAPLQPRHTVQRVEQPIPCCCEAAQDQEILELILSRIITPAEAEAVAHRLLQQFGDLNRVLTAPHPRLFAIAGVGEAVLAEFTLIVTCAHRMARARLLQKPVISSWQALLDYCHTVMAHRETEQFRVLFLDRKNMLIADAVLGEGTVDHVPVYPREVMRRALELNATALILVHNHPSGDPTPSEADICMTKAIRTAADALSITLHDHLIIGKSREISLRSEGLL